MNGETFSLTEEITRTILPHIAPNTRIDYFILRFLLDATKIFLHSYQTQGELTAEFAVLIDVPCPFLRIASWWSY